MDDVDLTHIDTSQVVYRPAEARDYQGVLDISEGLYGGRDIVPAMFHDYLKDPHRAVYVAVYKGKVLVLGIIRAVDNGKVLDAKSGRSHRAAQGLGLFHKMASVSMHQSMLPKFPGLKYARSVTMNLNDVSKLSTLRPVPRSLRVMIDIAWKVPVSAIETAIYIHQSKDRDTPAQNVVVEQAGRSDLKDIFTNIDFQRMYIPSGVLVKNSLTFGLGFIENIPLLLGDRCKNVFTSRDSNGSVTSLSFGTGVEMGVTMETYRYAIDYYGASQLDLLKAHITQHLADVPILFEQSQTVNNVYVCIYVLEETFGKSDLEAIVRHMSHDLQLVQGDAPIPQAKQILLHQDIDFSARSKI